VRARSTTIQAKPEFIDAGIAYMRDEVLPAVTSIDGCVGLSLLVDRESGRCIATTSWETEAAMHASTALMQPIRDRAVGAFGCTAADDTCVTGIDEWQIAVLRRHHWSADGACVRVTWLKIHPDFYDQGVDFYIMSVLRDIEDLEGFCSASLLTDRATGRAVASTTFDSFDAMDRNRDQSRALRTSALRDLGADQTDVGEFELAIAHLRVPEMA